MVVCEAVTTTVVTGGRTTTTVAEGDRILYGPRAIVGDAEVTVATEGDRTMTTVAEGDKLVYSSTPIATAHCDVYPQGMACHGGADSGTPVKGTVTFEQLTEDQCRICWDVTGLKPGLHGFHIHEKADFSNGCLSAGPHYNPFGKVHGGHDDEERHVGDMGNITADATGRSKDCMTDHLIKIMGEYTVVGRSVMVHADPDDLGRGDHSQPGVNGFTSKTTGNAGARIACGEIVLDQKK